MISISKIKKIEVLDNENIWYDICNIDPQCELEPNFILNGVIVHNSGMIKEYIENRKNPEEAKNKLNKIYLGLWNLLKETFGAIIYQEQVMFVLQYVGGFSLGEADKARKILKTLYKKGSENSQNIKFSDLINKFKQGAIQRGVPEKKAEKLLQTLSKYTGYTFNKCLSINTNIITPNGLKKLRLIKEGDTVLSYDYKKKDIYETKVKKVYKNGRKKLYKIRTDNGKIIEGVTLDHKFMCKDGKNRSLKEIIEKNLELINL